VQQDQREHKEFKDCRALQALQDQLEHKEFKVLQAQQAQQVPQEHLVTDFQMARQSIN
jgi:hypothetical protein